MTQEIELVQRHQPVLCFSKDGQDRPENFFPMAARHYVRECGLRRKYVGWEQPPGKARLRHLSRLARPEECYLAFAAGDLEDDDLILQLMDRGLEFSPMSESAKPDTDFSPGGSGEVVPRLLVSREDADDLEAAAETWGEVQRLSLVADEAAVSLVEAEIPPAATAPEVAFDLTAETEAFTLDAEMAAAGLEWVIPKGLAGLPERLHARALEKYVRYRDWETFAPVYHYHVCRDGPYRVLQYWFLYPYNDWSAHGGYNDHEGDWEMINVFLDGQDRPQQVAYSRHIRIPWLFEPTTAPWSEVERVEGDHPVVYVGCGSHASYLERGEHRILWRTDYAKGNDLSIGPGTKQPWGRPIRLDNKGWNLVFSGRWGALVKSWLGMVFKGTKGPTGPAQKGDKWHHPAKWAGLI